MDSDAPGPGDGGGTALQGHPASAPTPEQRKEPLTVGPEGRDPLFDDGQLLQQLFTRFSSIPFVGDDKPKGAALPERR